MKRQYKPPLDLSLYYSLSLNWILQINNSRLTKDTTWKVSIASFYFPSFIVFFFFFFFFFFFWYVRKSLLKTLQYSWKAQSSQKEERKKDIKLLSSCWLYSCDFLFTISIYWKLINGRIHIYLPLLFYFCYGFRVPYTLSQSGVKDSSDYANSCGQLQGSSYLTWCH